MTLQEELDSLRARFEAKASKEALDVMHRATDDLRRSGILAGVPKVGARGPEFALPNAAGALVSSRALLARGPLVVSFYRGRWWPYCNLELAALGRALPEITAAGATLVAISPQRAELSRELAVRHRLAFDLLTDHGNRVARQFGLVFTLPDALRELYRGFGVDLAKDNDDPAWTLPMPARFVLDPEGIIRAADVDPDYTVRPEPSQTVAVLRALPRGA